MYSEILSIVTSISMPVDMSSIFSLHSEAFASEFKENLEEISHMY